MLKKILQLNVFQTRHVFKKDGKSLAYETIHFTWIGRVNTKITSSAHTIASPYTLWIQCHWSSRTISEPAFVSWIKIRLRLLDFGGSSIWRRTRRTSAALVHCYPNVAEIMAEVGFLLSSKRVRRRHARSLWIGRVGSRVTWSRHCYRESKNFKNQKTRKKSEFKKKKKQSLG